MIDKLQWLLLIIKFIIGVQCEEDPLLIENRHLKEEVRRLQEELRKHK